MRAALLGALLVITPTLCSPAAAQQKLPLNEQLRLRFEFAQAVPERETQVYLPLLKQAMTAELQFVRRVCDPSESQFDAIHRAGLASVTSIAHTYAELKRRRTKALSWPDPNESLAAALSEAVREIMPAKVADRYDAETQARFKANQAANAALVTNMIDDQVILSLDQREAIYKHLCENWQSHWSKDNVLLVYSRYAVLPDSSVIRPHLNDLQRVLWASMPNRRTVSLSWQLHFGGHSFFGNAGLPEFALPDDRASDEGNRPDPDPGQPEGRRERT